MQKGMSFDHFPESIIQTLKHVERLVQQHGAGALSGFIVGLEYGAAHPSPLDRQVAVPSPSVPATFPAEPQVVASEPGSLESPGKHQPVGETIQREQRRGRPRHGAGPTQKERVLAAWRAGFRKPKAIAADTGINANSVSVYLGELRKAGVISESDPVSGEATADAELGKLEQSNPRGMPPFVSRSTLMSAEILDRQFELSPLMIHAPMMETASGFTTNTMKIPEMEQAPSSPAHASQPSCTDGGSPSGGPS